MSDYQILQRNLGRTGAIRLGGDIDADGIVNDSDINILRTNYGKYGTRAQGDLNEDGIVNFGDYQMLQLTWLKSGAPAFAPFGAPAAGEAVELFSAGIVPEPATISTLSILAIAGLCKRRRQTKN